MTVALPTANDVLSAARRIHTLVRRTPLHHSAPLSSAAGVDVWLKLENLQRTGSFKLRGALHRIATLSEDDRQRGLVTASAGNHGLGVAEAARSFGASATIFVPVTAPRNKRERIERSGAELRTVDGGYDDAHAAAEHHASESGRFYVHAFSDPQVVAGQGTVGLEILEELPAARTLLVPVGGGGLIGGIGRVARALAPAARVVGVQSEETAAMHASLAAGAVVSPPMGPTLCEGLSGDIDARSLDLAREVVDEMILVPETAVRRSIRQLYEAEGVVAEGSGVVAVAALWEGRAARWDGPVVAVVSGGNIDAAVLGTILTER